MKKMVLLLFVFAFAAVLIPVSVTRSSAEEELSPSAPISVDNPSAPSSAPSPEMADSKLTVFLLDGETVLTLPLDSYLTGVVAAEMPPSFSQEALRAQAVAARTNTVRAMSAPSKAHPAAHVCTDAGCCQAYASTEALREKWGDAYTEYLDIIRDAVTSTEGQIVVYEDTPALCVFHSSSAGTTESSADVWGGSLPYLVNVESPENAETVPDYVTNVVILQSEFRNVILQNFPDADLSGSPENWITDCSVTPGGRVSELTVGGVRISGTIVRSLFSLRSASFTAEVSGSDVIFTVTGYGHGVGMSQYGANVMAQDGADYTEILSWYYPGTSIAVLRPENRTQD